jgi:hypothetical protein
MQNLKIDIDYLDDYFKTISSNHLGFDECLKPIRNIINIFLFKKFEFYYNKNRYIDSFYDIKNEELIKFSLRYKNLKKSADMKGKVTESDISGFTKKLMELK